MHFRLGILGSDRFRSRLVLLIGKQISLIDQHDSLCPAAADDREIPFHPAKIEIGARIGNHDDDLDIGGDHLFLHAFSGGFP